MSHLIHSCVTIVSSLMHCWDFFTFDECINNPFKTLFALNHLDDKLSFYSFVVLNDPWLKLLVPASYLSNNVVSFLLKMNFAYSYKIKRSFDMNNRNCDIQFLDQLSDFNVNLVFFLDHKSHWSFVEKNMTLFLDFCV